MLVSFDIKFIRRDQKQSRNVDACQTVIMSKPCKCLLISSLSGETRNSVGMLRLVIENTICLSFDTYIKLIR